VGTNATFGTVQGIVLDEAQGLAYIADSTKIRAVNLSSGATRTLAGGGVLGNASGSSDGFGTAANFSYPVGLALFNRTLFLTDSSLIRTVSLDTLRVSTIAGQTGYSGTTNGLGTNAIFSSPYGIVVLNSSVLAVACGGGNIRILTLSDVDLPDPPSPPTLLLIFQVAIIAMPCVAAVALAGTLLLIFKPQCSTASKAGRRGEVLPLLSSS